MEKLKQELDRLIATLPDETEFRHKLSDLFSVYPFNEYEYIISTLLAAEKLTFDEYVELRDGYISRNRFLYIFEISAPRGFGEAWAQGHLLELVPDLVRPSKKLDKGYSGQYDFFFWTAKSRLKSRRHVPWHFDTTEPLYVKALATDSPKDFDMNFQQVKPACCDVFIWLGVWLDKIRYWVLASKEVSGNKARTERSKATT